MQGLTSFITAKASRVIAFGFAFLIGSLLLVSYYYYKSPAKVEDYYFTEINYQKVYFNKNADKIVIVSDTKEYGLSNLVLNFQEKNEVAEVLRKLSLSTKAEVWLDDKDAVSPFIRGLKTDNFFLPPEIGVNIDNKSNKSMVELFTWFIIGGAVIIILGVVKFFVG